MDFNVLQEMSLQGYFLCAATLILCAVVLIGFVCVFSRLGSILNELKALNGERYAERTGRYRQRSRSRDRSGNSPRKANSPVDSWLENRRP